MCNLEVFLDQWGLSFSRPLEYVSSNHVLTHFVNQFVIDGSKFLKQYQCMPSWPGVIEFSTFLSFALSDSRYIFAFAPSSSPSNSFLMLLINSIFFLMFFSFPYFASNFFVSLYINIITYTLRIFHISFSRFSFTKFE